ncbi:hypothetical protein HDE_11564 [Halotydeus destructor]|nr:hypothetical protein HDE_11564 [Halotydeus destructor]
MERPSFYKLPQDFQRQQASMHGQRSPSGQGHVSQAPVAPAGQGYAPQAAGAPSGHGQAPGMRTTTHTWQPIGIDAIAPIPYHRQTSFSPVPPSHPVEHEVNIDTGSGNASHSVQPGYMTQTSIPGSQSGKISDANINRGPAQVTPPVSPKPNYYLAGATIGHIPKIKPGGQHPVDQEKQIYNKERNWEREAVINQPYRTNPTIQPKPKPTHDYPSGSYLKYMHDPNWKSSPQVLPSAAASGPQPATEKLARVMNQFGVQGDNEKKVQITYNSPINLYSQQNVAEALMPTAMGQSPQPGTGGLLAAPGAPERDITQSPTYQLVHAMDQRSDPRPPSSSAASPAS